ncbi:DUF883 family protein [Caballeronia insecticola]|uniref:DUF883 domain-containing protein n=1 Tax=Caballeronia insecticola TaxID=758793 RepID=R4WW56_9BURK|nr:DUF883 family protein [Caballeronia insecticola]BAN23196.1 putative uncharacterized protein [Caballeronia insecticola]
MDQANGSAPAIQSDDAPLARRTVASAMEAALAPGMAQATEANVRPLAPGAAHKPAMNAPYHVHGSVLEGGDSPAVLAQPAAARAEGKGSTFHPPPRSARRTRDRLANAQDAFVVRYRRMSDGTDDFVHDNPWKAIAMAAVGGLIVGLLAAR